MSNAVNCQPGNGKSCHKKTKDPSGKCYLHQKASQMSEARAGVSLAPKASSNEMPDNSLDEKDTLAFRRNLSNAFPNSTVRIKDGTATVIRSRGWSLAPTVDVISIAFRDDSLDITYASGDKKQEVPDIDRDNIENAYRRVFQPKG